MENQDVSYFRDMLRSFQTESTAVVDHREGMAIESSPDEVDRIQGATEREYAISSLERETARVREVQSALLRLDAGLFGICASCESRIHPRRLKALPWARLCISCQEQEEQMERARRGDSVTFLRVTD